MSLIRYLLDEHIPNQLRLALRQRSPGLTVWRVGEPAAPPLGTRDPDLLLWCELNNFSLVTNNRASMPGHLRDHLAAGHHEPGIFVVGVNMTLSAIASELALIADASEAEEWVDQIVYLPLR
jgi:hypothetical protein